MLWQYLQLNAVPANGWKRGVGGGAQRHTQYGKPLHVTMQEEEELFSHI